MEEALASHPAVLEMAVVEALDEHGLAKPRAHVVVAPGHVGGEVLAQELIRHVRGRLPGFKCPRTVDFVDALPKTATGKILRFRLRQGDHAK